MTGIAHGATLGECSYYNTASCQREGTSGVWTASGERFYDNGMTCAMRSRDFGKYYKVTNVANGKSVIVKHNDYGPNKKLHKRGRIIDLSEGAFRKLANAKVGLIQVRIERIDK
jgi:rare lipoprotein A